MATKVIFRRFKDGEILALFPAIPGTNDPNTCMSYMHVGQHSDAHVSVVRSTKPASFEAYSGLMRELEGMGYELQIVKRFSPADLKTRIRIINEHFQPIKGLEQ